MIIKYLLSDGPILNDQERNGTMLKVLHGADFHLDSPFSGLKPDAAARRRGEQRELLAIPAGIQGAIFSVSNVFIQSGLVNRCMMTSCPSSSKAPVASVYTTPTARVTQVPFLTRSSRPAP